MNTTAFRGSYFSERRFFAFVCMFAFCVLLIDEVMADAAGRIGRSGAPPRNRDCTGCHTAGAAVPQVSINGPTSVAPGSTNNYTFGVMGGVGASAPAGVAGLNVAASGGLLAATDPNTKLDTAEITHVSPTPLGGNGVTYSFDFIAPTAAGTITLYAAGLSGDGDNSDQNDGTATTSFVVTVGAGSTAPAPPATPGALTAVISGPANAVENADLTYDAGNSTVAGATIVSYDWDLGDGTTASGVSVTHAFALGNYVVSLLVTDDTGATNSAQLDVAITAIGTNASPGAVLYAVNCEECHGAGGVGTLEAPVIVGASAESIADNIESVPVMNALAEVLSEDDIEEIAQFLVPADAAAVDSIGVNRFARSTQPPSRGNAVTSDNPSHHQLRANNGALGLEFALLLLLVLLWGRLSEVLNSTCSKRAPF